MQSIARALVVDAWRHYVVDFAILDTIVASNVESKIGPNISNPAKVRLSETLILVIKLLIN